MPAPGRSLKVDLHTHILPGAWPDLRKKYGYGGFLRLEPCDGDTARLFIDERFFREIDSRCWDPFRRLADCETHGVDLQVLSTVPVMFSYWARPEDTLDLARLLNDGIAAVVREHPGRFVGLGTLPMQAPDLAVGELERCMSDLGMAGVQIGSHVNEWNLDRPEIFTVLEAAQDLGAAVFVHPWDMMGGARLNRYMLAWLVGMPAETSLAICSLLFSGALERLPRLKLAFAHGGGAFPATLGRIQQGFDGRPDLCAADCSTRPRDFMGRFYLDTLVHDPAVLRLLIDLVGAERLALGSDYPFPLGEARPGALIESLEEITPETRLKLLGGTALEFLGLEDHDVTAG
ncbi:MAG: amidohydrolase family protein [Acidobacteriota bacterium]